MLTQTEYQYWIEYLQATNFPVPKLVIQDMSNWRHCSILARALVRAGKCEPAIELFKSVLDIEVDAKEADCFTLTEMEDKVWCLKELAICIWKVTEKRSEALPYLEEALTLITKYPTQFNFLDRCEVWREIQDFIFFTTKRKDRKAKNDASE